MSPSRMIYLATPYSHPDPFVRKLRTMTVTWVAAKLREIGLNVYSPISHSHDMAEIADLPKDIGYWEEDCTHHVIACSRVVVLMQDGWEESTGVAHEIDVATTFDKPVTFVELSDFL